MSSSPVGFVGAVALTASFALASPAGAQLSRKDLSVDTAVTIATTAMADCKAKGWAVSTVVVGRNGEILVQLRGDGTGPHTMENAFKKSFTARTFRIASGEMEERLKKNPQMGAQYLTGFTTGRGASHRKSDRQPSIKMERRPLCHHAAHARGLAPFCPSEGAWGGPRRVGATTHHAVHRQHARTSHEGWRRRQVEDVTSLPSHAQ